MKPYWMVAAVALCLVTGCGKSLVGTWTSRTEADGRVTETERTFEADGDYRAIQKTTRSNGVVGTSRFTGSWKLDDGKLTITTTDLNVDLGGMPPELAAQAKLNIQENRKQIIDRGNERQKNLPVEWKGNAEFTLAFPDGKKSTYKRKG